MEQILFSVHLCRPQGSVTDRHDARAGSAQFKAGAFIKPSAALSRW